MKVLKVLLLMCLVANCFTVTGQSAKDLWLEANQAYADANYLDAIRLFEEVREEGRVSYALYFNLGNAYMQAGDVARAVLNYKRALRLRPANPDIRYNLSLAENKVENKVIEAEGFFLVRWLLGIAISMSPFSWGVCFLSCLWLSIWIFSRYRVPEFLQQRPIFAYVFAALALLCLVFGSWNLNLRHDKSEAVVMQRSEFRIAPDSASAVIRTLHPGESVRLIDRLPGYNKVRLVNYEEGWLSVSAVQRVRN